MGSVGPATSNNGRGPGPTRQGGQSSSPGSKALNRAELACAAIFCERSSTCADNALSASAAPVCLTTSATSRSTWAFENVNGVWGCTASHALGFSVAIKSAFERILTKVDRLDII